MNLQPQLLRHLTISHAVPACALLKNFFLLLKNFWIQVYFCCTAATGGKCENKKKEIVMWNRLNSKVAVTNSQTERKRLCDGFCCVAAWALSHQQQELRQFSLWPRVPPSPQRRQNSEWGEGRRRLYGAPLKIVLPIPPPKTLCRCVLMLSVWVKQGTLCHFQLFVLSLFVVFWSEHKKLATSNTGTDGNYKFVAS